MEGKELRIGNYVSFNWSEDQCNRVFQVREILQESVHIGDGKIALPIAYYENILPIPLTEEWLLKFGFSDKNYKNGYIGKDFKSGGMILDFVLSKPFSKGEWNNTYTFDFEGHRFSKMEFVHELQNFYYCLTGVMLSLS